MPSAVYVPSKWNDLALDVNVGTPAQGAVAYFGGSFWNALPPGTNGQVLTSGGPGANPSWTTAAGGGGGLLGATLQVGTDLTGTFSPAALGGPVGNFTDIQAVVVGSSDNSGANSSGAGLALVDPVSLSKGWDCNLYYAAYNPVAAAPFLPTFVFGSFGLYNDNGTGTSFWAVSEIQGSGYPLIIQGGGPTPGATAARVAFGVPGAASQSASSYDGQVTIFCPAASLKGAVLRAAASQSANMLEWQDSTGAVQMAVAGNGRDFVLDTGTGTRWGTAATQKQAWWGAPPVVRPTLAAAATDLASVIALANSLRSAQIALGLGA